MLFDIFLLLIGFVLLVKGAGLLVDGASGLAKRIGVTDLVIGLTVVSFGTSAPELVVNILSAVRGSTDLALGNIIGSNISNTLLILGVAALIFPLRIKNNTVWKEIPLVLLASVALFLLANDDALEATGMSAVTRIDGLMLLLLFSIFLYYTFGIGKQKKSLDGEYVPKLSAGRATAYVVVGLVGLALGGKWIVDGAVSLASGFGLSEALIGLTILAIGTSLPELAASAVAAWKKNPDIAVGNVVGSNLFNILLVLGVTSVMSPLPVSSKLNFDMGVMILAALLLFAFVFIGRKYRSIERWEGASFIVLYVAYLVFISIRG